MNLEQIILKIDKLNAAIEHLENYKFQETKDKHVGYMAEINGKAFFLAKWLNQLKAPKIQKPKWHQDETKERLKALVKSSEVNVVEVAAELNLYVLNAAIKLSQLKAEKTLALQVEELRIIIYKFSEEKE